MRTTLIIVSILITNVALAAIYPSIKTEIEAKVHPDLSQYSFDDEHENFVVVSFTLTNEGIELIDIQGSSHELIGIMTDELTALNFDAKYTTQEIHYYKFVFKQG